MLAEVNFSTYILRPFETGASRPMSTHRMVRALAGEIATMKETQSKIRKKAAKFKKIELVRFLTTAPKTESTQQKEIRFEELLDKCFVGHDSKKRNNLLMIPKLAEIAAPLYALTG
jgi:hypothetical protein